MKKVIFLASTHQAGVYWAKLWGFTRSEVAIVTPDRPDSLHGWSGDIPVYLCGPTIMDIDRRSQMWEAIENFQMHGNVIYDAHEMGGEPRQVVYE